MGLFYYGVLFSKLEPKVSDPSFLRGAKEKALAKLKKYHVKAEANLTYLCSTVMDPRIKINFLEEEAFTNPMISKNLPLVTTVWENEFKPVYEPPTKKATSDFSFGFRSHTGRKDELKAYLAMPLIETEVEEDSAPAYQYWKDNSKSFPNLSVMAKKYLNVPMSSVSSERLFSAARHMMKDNQQSMTVDKHKELVLLREWAKLSL